MKVSKIFAIIGKILKFKKVHYDRLKMNQRKKISYIFYFLESVLA